MSDDTEPSAEAWQAADELLRTDWLIGSQHHLALALDRFRAAGVREEQNRLMKIVESERVARWKCEIALRRKDEAMGVLISRLGAAGIDCSDLFP